MRRALVVATLTTLTFGCGGGEFIEGSPTVLPVPANKVGTVDAVTISKRIRPDNLASEFSRPDRNRLVVIPEDSRLDVDVQSLAGRRTYSIEMWLQLDDETDQTIMSSNDLAVSLREGRLRVRIGDRTVRSAQLGRGEWYHLALSVDRAELRVFINGGLSGVSELDTTYPDALGRMLHIGGVTEGNGRGFSGRVDNLRLLSVRYTAARGFIPSTVLKPRDGVVAAFDFNDGEAPGEKVNASTGALVGVLVHQAHIVNGKI